MSKAFISVPLTADASVAPLLARREALLGPNAPLFYDAPLHLVHGQGVWLFDHAGNRYLDAYNNVPHVGHSHPAVGRAVCEQVNKLNTHSRYLSKVVLDYHERLLNTFDMPAATAMLTCTGSEANELALRIARHVTGGMGVIVTRHTYHGNTAAVSEISTAYGPGLAFLPPHVRAVRAPQTLRPVLDGKGKALRGRKLLDDYLADVRQALGYFARNNIRVAALLIDPIFSTDGLPDVPVDYVKEAVALVRAAGGLYIADEVQPGLGRTGAHVWGYQAYGTVPDIVTLGKPLGNGYPLAGVVARAELIASFRKEVMYFNTFSASPVACAAGTAVLNVLEDEGLMANAAATGSYLKASLRSLARAHPCIADVRGSGLFLGVEIVSRADGITADPALARRIVEGMRNAGVLIAKVGEEGNVLKVRPPMSFSAAHADLLVHTLDQVLSATA